MNKRLKSDIEFLNDLNRIAFYEEGKNKGDKLVEEVYDYYNLLKDIGAGAIGLGKSMNEKRKNSIVGDINKSIKDLTKDNGFFQKIFYDTNLKNENYSDFDIKGDSKILKLINNTGKVKRGKSKEDVLADAFMSKLEYISHKRLVSAMNELNPEKLKKDLEETKSEADAIKRAKDSLPQEQQDLFKDIENDVVVDETLVDETKVLFKTALVNESIEEVRADEIVDAILGTAKIEGEEKTEETTEETLPSKYTSEQINDLRNKLSTTDKDTLIDFSKKATPADETTMTELSEILMTAGITEEIAKIIITALGTGTVGDINFTAENIKQLLESPFSEDEFTRFFDILKPNDQAFKDLFLKSYKSTDEQEQKDSYDKLKTALEKVKEIDVSTDSNTWFLSNVDKALGENRNEADEDFIKKIIDGTVDTEVTPEAETTEEQPKEFNLETAISDIKTKPEYKKLLDMAKNINDNTSLDELLWDKLGEETNNEFINEIKEKFPNITKENQTEILKTILPKIIFPGDTTKSKEEILPMDDIDRLLDDLVLDIFDDDVDQDDAKIQKIAKMNSDKSWDTIDQNSKDELIKLLETKGISNPEDHLKAFDKIFESSKSHNKDKMIEESIINYIEVLKDIFDDLTEEELESKIRDGLSLSDDYNIKRLLGGIE